MNIKNSILSVLSSPGLISPGLISLGLILLVGCGGTAPEAGAPTAAPSFNVEVAVAVLESVPVRIRASGSLEPWIRVSPGTKILGRVEHVAVREGDRVERGALLARLENRDLEAAVNQAEANLRMAEARLENARAQRDRMVALHGRGSVTAKNLEDAMAAFRVAEASVDQARANTAAARVTRSYAEIRSPLAGWVVAKRIEAGDMATPGTPLFTIEDLSRVKVHVQVPEAAVVGLEVGTPALVTVLDRQTEAAIDRIVPSGDPASRTFSVKLLLANPDGTFKSGMFARVSFSQGEHQALRVPAAALIHRGQLEGLFIAGDDERLHLRWVKTGRHEDGRTSAGRTSAGRTSAGRTSAGRTEILSGLEAGERYVVAPPPGLTDGASYQEIGS